MCLAVFVRFSEWIMHLIQSCKLEIVVGLVCVLLCIHPDCIALDDRLFRCLVLYYCKPCGKAVMKLPMLALRNILC